MTRLQKALQPVARTSHPTQVACIAGPALAATNGAVVRLPEADQTLDDFAVWTGFTPAFQALVDETRARERQADELHVLGYKPARAMFDELMAAAADPKLIEHIEIYGGQSYGGEPVIRRSADTVSVAVCRRLVEIDGRRIDPNAKGYCEHDVVALAAARKVLAVHLWRERQEKRALAKVKAEADRQSGLSDAIARSTDAANAFLDALDAMLSHPASNPLEFEEQCRWNETEECEAEAELLASARRLFAEMAA